MLIEAKNVVKAFGAFKAVDDASVSVEEGDILGLIGPNGAGRSPVRQLKKVDLPAPLGPMMPRSSPRSTAKSIPSLANTPP